MSKEVKLDESERKLVALWRKELIQLKTTIEAALTELMLHRLEKIARDKGLNLKDENWTFDALNNVFIRSDAEDTKEDIKEQPVEAGKDK